ncbi:hypothetical protein KIN34_02775 [Cellulomonas sp. DKR-3]|uniref:Uncharacterized protein n=1 Tax=Cellulomonas fulva TaxID=2835530 RepID=A0ABS5TVP5_9CELL|nr:hypothetical protein [Cellulomonas fulva]MBT0993213.1 hypothetical protein [Cellulomonas fulva]
MTRIEFAHHGYSVHLTFSMVIDGKTGRPRQVSRAVRIELDGVQLFMLHGGLNIYMLEHPENIDWGLSEVAHVSIAELQGGIQCDVKWEGDRSISVECRGVVLQDDC